MDKDENNRKSIKIKSIQANSLYAVNSHQMENDENKLEQKRPYLDLGEAVISQSLFSDYMIHHGVKLDKRGRSKDFIVMKFDYGVKGQMTAKELREYYYENGAKVTWEYYDSDGHVVSKQIILYKMLMRSPGKAKEGHCIFVRDKFHEKALKYLTMDLWDKMPLESAPIVEMSAYAPLVSATAIDYITIPMENILIIKDKDVHAFVNALRVQTKEVPHEYKIIDWAETEKLINTYGLTFYKKKQKKTPGLRHIDKTMASLEENGITDYPMITEVYYRTECCVDRQDLKTKVTNTIFDGMGLIDESIFPKDKGMNGFIYCRSHFFKSCLFRGNIQDYFKDYFGDKYDTATVIDMFGNKFRAKNIKVIVTENSIKWVKPEFVRLMGDSEIAAYQYYKNFMKRHKEKFAIVKTAHASKYGELQRSSYQINNSLPCLDVDTLKRIAKVSIIYCNKLKTDHKAFMKHLSINASKYSINNVLIALDEWNESFKYTQYFKDKKNEMISKFKNERLKLGKLLQYGDNLTICGNPIAMLMKATGQNVFEENCFEKVDGCIQCYTTRFQEGEKLAGFRSPHNSPNNIVYLENVYPKRIKRYFPNLGKNVIIINGINTDVQSRLNGQDLDTDSIYATNQPDIVKIAQRAYSNYPTIINDIELIGKSVYGKDMKSYARMDNDISSAQYGIGMSSNIAQLALSYYFDGEKCKELEDVFIICSVLAQVAIDSAKRTFNINVNGELARLSGLSCMQPEDGKKYPVFYAGVQELKNRGKKKKKEIKEDEVRFFNTPMEMLADVIEENVIDIRKYKKIIMPTYNLNTVFQYKPDRKRDSKQYKKVISVVQEYDMEVKKLDISKSDYSKDVDNLFDICMEKLKNLSINKTTMSALITYAFIPNGNIRDRLLTVLYDKDKKMFLNSFKKSTKTPAQNLEITENKGA